MADILERILETKRLEVEEAQRSVPLGEVERLAATAGPVRGFAAALRSRMAAGRPAIIAEIKRASPSQGAIRPEVDVAAVAASYERHGAACLSVLTDRSYFRGSEQDLRMARAACGLPVLRKDFIIDAYQVFEARAWGADCILLIIDAASDDTLRRLARQAEALGLDVLVECHDAPELERAIALDTALVGINNRSLRSFETRIDTTLELAARVPAGRLMVTESGISRAEDIARLRTAGVNAYLVGTALMKAADPGVALEALFSGY